MKLESTTFRPREVVQHVLQTAAASLKKELTLEGCIGDDVPVEVKIIPYPFLFDTSILYYMVLVFIYQVEIKFP